MTTKMSRLIRREKMLCRVKNVAYPALGLIALLLMAMGPLAYLDAQMSWSILPFDPQEHMLTSILMSAQGIILKIGLQALRAGWIADLFD